MTFWKIVSNHVFFSPCIRCPSSVDGVTTSPFLLSENGRFIFLFVLAAGKKQKKKKNKMDICFLLLLPEGEPWSCWCAPSISTVRYIRYGLVSCCWWCAKQEREAKKKRMGHLFRFYSSEILSCGMGGDFFVSWSSTVIIIIIIILNDGYCRHIIDGMIFRNILFLPTTGTAIPM